MQTLKPCRLLLCSDFVHFVFLPVHSLASGGRAARSASCSLTSVRAQTPAAAFGTQCFVLVMLTNRTAFAPLAPILDYTMLAKGTPIANLTVTLDFLVNAIKASLALFAGISRTAVLAQAASSTFLATMTMYSVLANA